MPFSSICPYIASPLAFPLLSNLIPSLHPYPCPNKTPPHRQIGPQVKRPLSVWPNLRFESIRTLLHGHEVPCQVPSSTNFIHPNYLEFRSTLTQIARTWWECKMRHVSGSPSTTYKSLNIIPVYHRQRFGEMVKGVSWWGTLYIWPLYRLTLHSPHNCRCSLTYHRFCQIVVPRWRSITLTGKINLRSGTCGIKTWGMISFSLNEVRRADSSMSFLKVNWLSIQAYLAISPPYRLYCRCWLRRKDLGWLEGFMVEPRALC